MQLKTLITSITLMVGMSMSYYIQAATSVEQQHANYMLEEEKLARDLYLSLGAKWDLMPLKTSLPPSKDTLIA